MLSAGYFHPFSSRVAASVVGIDKDRKGQWSSSSRAILDKNWILFTGANIFHVFLLQRLLQECVRYFELINYLISSTFSN
jgi:hypothetical protein